MDLGQHYPKSSTNNQLTRLGYTKSVLKDALSYNDHARNSTNSSVSNNTINTDDIRLSIASRTNYQFKSIAPKELLLELAQERNSKPLPPVIPKWGLNLPPEKYCLTGTNVDEEGDSKRQKTN